MAPQPGVFQGATGDAVQLPRHAARRLVGQFHSLVGEQVAGRMAGDSQPMTEVIGRVLQIKRIQVEPEVEPVPRLSGSAT